MKLSRRLLAVVLAALPLVLCTFLVETNSEAQTPPPAATPPKQDPNPSQDFPALASGPAPKGVQDAITRSNGKIAYTQFVRQALIKNLGSPAFVAAAGIPKDATGKAKPEEITADQVIQAIRKTAHNRSGGVPPKNLGLESAKQNALADVILNKAGLARAAKATAPRKNALTGDVLSSTLARFDWRDYGWVALQSGIISRAKNQGDCGSCWAFATIGTFEGAYALTNQRLINGSEQNLLDCYAMEFGTEIAPYNCQQGGWWAFNQIINPGVADGEDGKGYSYVGEQQQCQDNVSTPYQAIAWKYVFADPSDNNTTTPSTIPSNMSDIQKIKDALCQYGPVGTAIHADPPTGLFGGYGANSPPISDFPNGQQQLNAEGELVYTDHLIVIVGWDDSKNAWAIKNSWGEDTWGDQGFGYVDYFSNNIGYGSVYVIPVPAPATPAGAGAGAGAGAVASSVAKGFVPRIPKHLQRKMGH